ncbi:MAG: enoyl-CoA hydratase/isomerase family protein [Synergistetes bacterium]|nr:enoyl-CoA hydratase/isomerase family protein [Synergistota bacterium]
MKYKTILLQKDKHIGTIVLNRPESLNTFTKELATELNSALREMDKDSKVRVVIVKGSGKGFSAGIDVKELKGKSMFQYYEITQLMEEMTLTISSMKKVVIASVHGFAVANGIGLVAASDLAIAAEGTKFGATAINIGLSCIGPAVPLSRSLGRKRTLELLFTGKVIEAKEAEKIGLVNKVVPKEELEKETLKLAHELASKSPLALQLTKIAFYRMADLQLPDALEISNLFFSTICTLEDAQEGINAFLEKRTPEWKMK